MRRRDWRGAVAAAAAILVAATGAAAQTAQSTKLAEAPCGGCELTVTLVTSLGEADGPASLGGPPVAMASDSRGRLYLADGLQPTQLMVFSPNGSFLTTIGNAGQGPGEFGRITHFFISGDTLHVFDRRSARETLMTLGGEFIQSHQVEGIVGAAAVGREGRLLVNALVSSPERIGLPLHWMAPDGQLEASFGSDGTFFARQPLRLQRSLTRSPDGYWSAPPYEYVLSEWDDAGGLSREFRRETSWFEPWEPTRPDFSPDRLPNPVLKAIRALPGEILLTASLVGARDWAEVLGQPIQTEVGPRYPAAVSPRAWNTILEAVDTKAGRVIVSARIDPQVFGFINDDLVFTYKEVGAGIPVVEVWQVRLVVDQSKHSTGG